MPEYIKLKQDILKNGSLSDIFRNKLSMLNKEVALDFCAGIINEYNEHNNLFLAVQLTDEILKRKGTNYLNVFYNLKEQIVPKNVSLSLKNRLYMNIELLELEANTDIDRIECPCGIYSKYNENPENCPDFTIFSKNNPSGGYVNYIVYKAKCNTCGKRWKIEMEEVSANKMTTSWFLDLEE